MVLRLVVGLSLFAVLSCGTAMAAGAKAPLQIVVSKDQQSVVVYDGDTVVATSRVSTGKRGHETPTGIFSILEKNRHHKSNIYSDAPMPFMQRLTWSGIALHASSYVPARPASHGCVRLPNDFAAQLYKMTGRGLHVLISDRQLVPVEVSHPLLFQPVTPPDRILSDAQLRPTVSQVQPRGSIEVAMGEPSTPLMLAAEVDDRAPIRMLITRRTDRETTLDVQTLLGQSGYDVGIADGLGGEQTRAAVTAFQTASGLTPDGKITPSLVEALYRKAGKGTPPNGQLMVRRDFQPLFEVPVVIAHPEIALGTHFFQFQDVDPATGKGNWFGMSLDNALPKGMKKRLGITTEEDAAAFNAAYRTLDRITFAEKDTASRIGELLAQGSSLTVSDMGLGQETGKGTDFVTITHAAP